MKIFKKMKKGFTLVELVVVIAVIAILAAVSVGAYFGVTESVNNSRLEQEAKQVHTAIQTVALVGDEHSSLNRDGLVIKDAFEFEKALEENLGKTVIFAEQSEYKDLSEPTIYFSSAEYTKSQIGGETVYKTFEYYVPEIGGKKTLVDVVTGEARVVTSNAQGEELPETLPTVRTIEEAISAPENSPVEISGIVTVAETYSEQHSNITFTITDGTNSIEVYRSTFDSQLVRGDIVIVKGTIGVYQGVNQVKQGAVVTKTGHDTSYDEVVYVTSIVEALASEDDTYVKLTGTVISIETPYSDQYGNISLTIADEQGNKIFAYRTKGNAELLDIVEITGVMDTHNSQRQITEDSDLVKLGTKHTCSNYHEADCLNPAKCIVCNAVQDGSAALDHIDETGEGECDRCGYNINTQTIVFTIGDYATANSWVNETQYKTVNINEFITATITGTTNSGKYYTSDRTWRLYETENSTLEVTASYGAIINSIKINYLAKNNGTFVECNSGETVEVNGDSATFTVAILDDEVNTSIQITSIEISFIPGELPPHTDHTFDTNGKCTYAGCNETCSHAWINKTGFCDVCGSACDHTLNAGDTCDNCGYTKPGKLTGEQNVSVTIANYADENEWVNQTRYTSVEIDANVTASVSEGINTGKYYTNGENWRTYQNENATLTISVEDGYTIISVIVTYASDDDGVLILKTRNVLSGTTVNVYKDGVTFNVGNTASATNGKANITKIEVAYINSDEFVKPSHEHNWNTDGTCKDFSCDDICSHAWTNKTGFCDVCGFKCDHTLNAGDTCNNCGFVAPNQEPVDPNPGEGEQEKVEKTLTLSFKNDYGISTGSYVSGEFTTDGVTFGYSCLKSYKSNSYVMFEGKKDSMIYNTTAIPGKITKLEVTTSGGISTSAIFNIGLFSSKQSTYISSGTQLKGQNKTVTLTGTEADNYCYFNISNLKTTTKNGQITSIVITYLA